MVSSVFTNISANILLIFIVPGTVLVEDYNAIPRTAIMIKWEDTGCMSNPVPVTYQFSSVQSFSRVQLFAIPWTAPRQASLSLVNSQCLLKLMSIESVMHQLTGAVAQLRQQLLPMPSSGGLQHQWVPHWQNIPKPKSQTIPLGAVA